MPGLPGKERLCRNTSGRTAPIAINQSKRATRSKEAGGCVLTELHEKGGQWTRVQRPPASEIDGRASLRCSRCGSVNPPGSTVCEICGTPLDNATPEPEAEPWNRPNWQNPPAGNMGGGRFSGQGGAYGNGNPNPYDQNPYRQGGPGAPFQMPFDPFVNPMGGLDPEEGDGHEAGAPTSSWAPA